MGSNDTSMNIVVRRGGEGGDEGDGDGEEGKGGGEGEGSAGQGRERGHREGGEGRDGKMERRREEE